MRGPGKTGHLGDGMKRPVLRYFGGKFRLADWIISHFPEHRVYVEPYGGAASVLMKKKRSYAEIWNDLDDSLYSLFCVIKEPRLAEQLKQNIEATPFSRREFELAHVYHPDPLEKARRLVVRSFMGFGADSATRLESKTGFRSNSNRSGTTPAHDWVNFPKNIPGFCERMMGVVIENRNAIDVMITHDSEETLHYIDPPYPTDTRRGGRYAFEMDIDDHRELVDFISTLKGMVIVSGYDHAIYNSLGWNKFSKQARADKAGIREEILWVKP